MENLYPDFTKRGGLLPVVVQDVESGEVLMLAYADEEAYQKTIETGLATYYSTSRKELWVKGLTSGNTQQTKAVLIDCDNDALLYKVIQQGQGACHTGNKTCFYRSIL
jgi:phosphoribosyl-AMP cyclohydrolase